MSTKSTTIRAGIISVVLLGLAFMITVGMSRNTAYAADGDLDLTFSGDGKVNTDFGDTPNEARAVAMQADGKIVAVGTTFVEGDDWDFAVVRYNPDGTLDNNFGQGGKVTTDFFGFNDGAFGVAIQPDGKIVVVGTVHSSGTDVAIARYNISGTPDTTFSEDGKAAISFNFSDTVDTGYFNGANAVTIQPNGKIVIAGYARNSGGHNFLLMRLSSNGELDETFDTDGRLSTDFAGGTDEARSVTLQPDGKIIAVGNTQISGFNYGFAAARYNTDGSLDNSFNGDGKATVNFISGDDGAYGVALQSDGKIVLAGAANLGNPSNYSFALARLTTTGELDTSFNGDGKFTNDISGNSTSDGALALAIQPDGKIVAAGFAPPGTGFDNFALIRLTTGGDLDTSFSGDGKVFTDFAGNADRILGVTFQSDGKIVAAGYADFGVSNVFDIAVARYEVGGGGSPTPTSIPTSTSTPPPGSTPTVCPVQFPDVPPGSTFYEFVRCLACRSIVSGLPDGTFGVNNPVTRGQLSKIVSNAAGFNENAVSNTFEDVPVGTTFHQFVERLVIRGIINGFQCGGVGEPCVPPNNLPYFRPNNNVTRGQTSKIVASARGLPAPPAAQQTFEDVGTNSTFWQWVEALATAGSINGFSCGSAGELCVPPNNRPYFRPSSQVTRGQAVKIVSNTFFPGCATP